MKKQEKGQIIVFLAVALVAVLMVTALAVDGSMIYQERRDDQSTADSTALVAAQMISAGTYTACDTTVLNDAMTNALNYAKDYESVTLAKGTTSGNRVEAVCTDSKTLDIKVTITSTPQTNFTKVLSKDTLTTTVQATSRVIFGSAGTFAGGNGLWATGPTCDANGGIWLEGEGQIAITGGGVYSKSCISIKTSTSFVITDGQPIQYSGKIGTNVKTVEVGTTPKKVVYLGTSGLFNSNGIMLPYWQKSFVLVTTSTTVPSYGYQITGATSVNTSIEKEHWPDYVPPIDSPVLTYTMTAPDCTITSTYKYYTTTNEDTRLTYEPGVYSNITPGDVDVTFKKGIYCIQPGGKVYVYQNTITADNTYFYFMPDTTGVKASTFELGGSVTLNMDNSAINLPFGNLRIANGTFNAEEITIYIAKGNFSLENGAFGATLKAPTCSDSFCGLGYQKKGVLVYMPVTNPGTFQITEGNGTHKLTGTVYAPNALATFTGGSKVTTNDFQLIAKRIYLNGSATITWDTNNGNLYSEGGPGSVELLK